MQCHALGPATQTVAPSYVMPQTYQATPAVTQYGTPESNQRQRYNTQSLSLSAQGEVESVGNRVVQLGMFNINRGGARDDDDGLLSGGRGGLLSRLRSRRVR